MVFSWPLRFSKYVETPCRKFQCILGEVSAGQRIAAVYAEKKLKLAEEFGLESKWTFSEEFQQIWLYNVYGFAIKKLVIGEEKRLKEESVSMYLENNKSALHGNQYVSDWSGHDLQNLFFKKC